MNLENIGFIHCDAQGAENFIFSKGIDTIKKCRPVVYYENNEQYGWYLYDNVCYAYPAYKEESEFNIATYCMKKLNYSKTITYDDGRNLILIP